MAEHGRSERNNNRVKTPLLFPPGIVPRETNKERGANKLATLYIKKFIDDLTGEEISETEMRTIRLTIAGKRYVFDTDAKGAETFYAVISPYIQREDVEEEPAPAPSSADRRAYNRRVRVWAAANGFELSPRGQIPRDVIAAFEDAHG